MFSSKCGTCTPKETKRVLRTDIDQQESQTAFHVTVPEFLFFNSQVHSFHLFNLYLESLKTVQAFSNRNKDGMDIMQI